MIRPKGHFWATDVWLEEYTPWKRTWCLVWDIIATHILLRTTKYTNLGRCHNRLCPELTRHIDDDDSEFSAIILRLGILSITKHIASGYMQTENQRYSFLLGCPGTYISNSGFLTLAYRKGTNFLVLINSLRLLIFSKRSTWFRSWCIMLC